MTFHFLAENELTGIIFTTTHYNFRVYVAAFNFTKKCSIITVASFFHPAFDENEE